MSEMRNLMLPGNPRYQPKSLIPYFGYDNLMRPVVEVEIATMLVLGEIGIIPPEEVALFTPEVTSQLLSITTSEVDQVERQVTKHDIRALVRITQGLLSDELKRWVHVPLTSYDPLDTARSLTFVRAHREVVRPRAQEFLFQLAALVKQYAGTLQIGRTHGQHALPITVGFWLATILYRILYCLQEMDRKIFLLVGKVSGAVGAHNAQIGLGFAARCGQQTFEERVLKKVGLKPSPISTQILPPEPLAEYLFSCTLMSAALGQLGRDCRNLMRTEIGEIYEPFESETGQVGSSTMAQKRNPISFENSEGMFKRNKKEFGGVMDTLISEHQRDLVDSSLYRDFPIIVVNLVTQLETYLRQDSRGQPFLARIRVDEAACRKNFEMSAHLVLAEPLYIALQMAGYEGDAHELINRQVVPLSQQFGWSLLQSLGAIAKDRPPVQAAIERVPPEIMALLNSPERYTGDAAEQALRIAQMAEDYFNI